MGQGSQKIITIEETLQLRVSLLESQIYTILYDNLFAGLEIISMAIQKGGISTGSLFETKISGAQVLGLGGTTPLTKVTLFPSQPGVDNIVAVGQDIQLTYTLADADDAGLLVNMRIKRVLQI